MAAIHDLLAQVQDEALKVRLEQEINRLSKAKKFGLVSNSLSKMLHFFSIKFATTLDFTGFPVISHLFTDGLTLECPFCHIFC